MQFCFYEDSLNQTYVFLFISLNVRCLLLRVGEGIVIEYRVLITNDLQERYDDV